MFLNIIKQLLKSRLQLVVHLSLDPYININAPPGRAENIGGVEELGKRGKKQLSSKPQSLSSLPSLCAPAILLSLISAAITPNKCSSYKPLGHRMMEITKCHASGELKAN